MDARERLHDLADRALLEKAAQLAHAERAATAELIAALAEIDARKLFLAEGYSSMFVYCTRVLHLSEHAAYDRIEAARIGRRFPVVLDRLACGALTLTNLRLLAPHLGDDTADALFDEAAHKSKHEVEAIVARLRPHGADAETYTLQFAVSLETREKLRRVQQLLRHAIPDGSVGKIFDRALGLLLAHLEKRKAGAGTRPRQSGHGGSVSRHVPMRVRREVWERDGGRCAFVGTQGRCEERGFLEFHHVEPYAAGGRAVVENIQLRCRAHNQHEASVFLAENGPSPDAHGGAAAGEHQAELVPGPVPPADYPPVPRERETAVDVLAPPVASPG